MSALLQHRPFTRNHAKLSSLIPPPPMPPPAFKLPLVLLPLVQHKALAPIPPCSMRRVIDHRLHARCARQWRVAEAAVEHHLADGLRAPRVSDLTPRARSASQNSVRRLHACDQLLLCSSAPHVSGAARPPNKSPHSNHARVSSHSDSSKTRKLLPVAHQCMCPISVLICHRTRNLPQPSKPIDVILYRHDVRARESCETF